MMANKTEQFSVIELDDEGDVVVVTGPFPSEKAAAAWMRDVAIPAFTKPLKDEMGTEVQVDLYSDGAVVEDLARWAVRPLLGVTP